MSIETLRCITDTVIGSVDRKDLGSFVVDAMDVNSAAAQMPRCEVVNADSTDEKPCGALAVSMVPGGANGLPKMCFACLAKALASQIGDDEGGAAGDPSGSGTAISNATSASPDLLAEVARRVRDGGDSERRMSMTIQLTQQPISAGFSPPDIESFFDDPDAWVVKTLYGMKAEMFITDRCPFSIQDAVLFRSACRLLQSVSGAQYKSRITKALTALKTAKSDFHFDHAVNTIASVIHPAASPTSLSRFMSDDDRGLLLRAIEQLHSQVLAFTQRDTDVMLLAGVGPLYRAFIARLTSVLRIPAILSLLPAGRVLLHSSGVAMYCNPFEFLVALAFDTSAIVVMSPSERELWHADQLGTAGTQNNMPAPSLGSSEPADWRGDELLWRDDELPRRGGVTSSWRGQEGPRRGQRVPPCVA